ncbi:uncharacterized protein BXZ73DRAFT_102073 [Epithele typhae]|uniref:uncharacterized protein n=1 Tax=Epithele typhae TaxID=378194 RepID=UPI00200777FB|nr:uncharacterized protein BXZ73DRAFT_110158 [Epithele typhae]XP_047877170.1 uncharacterized protein BXZ73DRAFT_102073 [Epithele typhae]KAH9907677.1 hypothetical protein BXZ73DRAFT_110158 [Epithele typhae]KAH9929543.1 hypothetical protein BXZ73DRAFT_102073 [Epithele typhae]
MFLIASTLHVPFKATGAISLIKAIEIGDLTLDFTQESEWAPVTNSRTVQARMELPFEFEFDIESIQNSFNITTEQGVVAGRRRERVHERDQGRELDLDAGDDRHHHRTPRLSPVFSLFNRNLTDSKVMPFMLNGQARAVTNTSISTITLDPIKFNVPSNLQGLQGLQLLVQIKSADVLSGSAEAIHLGIDVDIFNPSNLQLATGDMSLQLWRDGAVMGNNSVTAQGNFTPGDSPQGLEMLSQFVGGTNVQVVKHEPLSATVSLANPFTAALEITHISSNVTFRGISLGTIDDAVAFSSAGKSTTTWPALDLNLDMDPQSLLTVTKLLAEQAGEDTVPLDQIIALCGNFDLPSFVDKAFTKLATEPNVTIKADASLILILPVLAQLIVQNIENSFGTNLKGSIINARSFDAKIAFPEGFTIVWNDKALGSIKMPDVDVVDGVGVSFEVDAPFTVADVAYLVDFTKAMLMEEEFEWVIPGSNLSVAAIGISVPGIGLGEKEVTLNGMNGLKGGVKIETFDLPSNDPAGGNFFEDVNIGSVVSTNSFTLSPTSTVALPVAGRLAPQKEEAGLAAVSAIFNAFIHGNDIVVQGDSADPTDISWLNDGIKVLQVQTVTPWLRGGNEFNFTAGQGPSIEYDFFLFNTVVQSGSVTATALTLDATLLLNQTTDIVTAARFVDAGTRKMLAWYTDWPQPYRLVERPDPELKVVADVEEGRAHV